MTLPLRDSTEAELEAFSGLCDRLVNFGARCSPEYTDGFLTALAAGLVVPPFAEWIVPLAGDEFERTFADPEDRALAERTLSARLAVLRDLLDPESLDEWPDHLRLSPLMMQWTDEDRAEVVAEGKLTAADAAGLVTGADWADGFLDAIKAFTSLWPVADAEDLDVLGGLTLQVHALRLDEGSDALRQHIAITYGKAGADRDTLIDNACFAVQDMRLWAVDHAPKPETRRVDKTPGRNDPCPCGSGKKFKKCHGA